MDRTHILAAFSISILFLLITGCSINRADSLRELDRRAGYNDQRDANRALEVSMKQAGLANYKNSPIPVRTRSRVANVWIHPHETGSGDYFWGGWMSIVIDHDRWALTQPGKLPQASAVEELND